MATVSPYRQALADLRRAGATTPILERVSQLVALHELATALGGEPSGEPDLESFLRILAGELGVARAAVFLRSAEGVLLPRASHGLPPASPLSALAEPPEEERRLGPGEDAHGRHGLERIVPIRRHGRTIAALGLGPREGGREPGAEERDFLGGAAACLATALENGRLADELRRARRRLSVRELELHNLFDMSRELWGGSAEDAILDLVTTTAMGHFVVSRSAVYVLEDRGLSLARERGVRRELAGAPLPPEPARAALQSLPGPTSVSELPQGPLRRRLEKARLVLAVPLRAGSRVGGLLAIGERASGTPFSEDDRDFAQTLARQAMAAIEAARLARVREEKERQDRELQIAREIQKSLFPPRLPEVPGFELAAESRPCHEVGGDSYDWVPLGRDRLAIVVADVSGKGTPASLLMASVHASVHALAGTASPVEVVERLNRFLYANTQPSRFVTLFYAELDTARRRLVYVNAGHVPPFVFAGDGTLGRLREGGAALGLLDDAAYEAGEVRLEPGDVLAVITDGVTEAAAADERLFGDEKVDEVLRTEAGASASAILEGLVAAVDEWTGRAGLGDDLTALVLRAR